MQIQELNWYSERLHRQMPLKIYGRSEEHTSELQSQR